MASTGQTTKARQKQMVEDLENQLWAARDARENKLVQSKEHLLAQLNMAKQKYLTVNGYMQVRQTIQQVAELLGEYEGDLVDLACDVAFETAEIAGRLAEQINLIDVFELDETVLDGYLATDFVNDEPSLPDVVRQLQVVHLLQNVGPVIDELVAFRNSTLEGIEKLEAELAAQTAQKPEPTVSDGGGKPNLTVLDGGKTN